MRRLPSEEEKAFIRAHLATDWRVLALRSGGWGHCDRSLVIRQVAGYQALAKKVPSWAGCPDLLLPDGLAIEQCSSEQTALYKVSLVQQAISSNLIPAEREGVIDLTGGLGVDCFFLASRGERTVYVEQKPELADIARYNFKVLGRPQIEVYAGDGLKVLQSLVTQSHFSPGVVLVDPSRRNSHGGRVFTLSQSEPDLTVWKEPLLKETPVLLVKLSPLLDISEALRQLPETIEVHVVDVANECKELLLVLSGCSIESDSEAMPVLAVHLDNRKDPVIFRGTRQEERASQATYTDQIGHYLYEPYTSVLKAGYFSLLSSRFGVAKLHPNTHLYTSDYFLPDFPGRAFTVESVLSAGTKILHESLKGMERIQVAVRNFPETAAHFRRRTGLQEGADLHLMSTTLFHGRKVAILCRPFPSVFQDTDQVI
jgi:hypothetical protein